MGDLCKSGVTADGSTYQLTSVTPPLSNTCCKCTRKIQSELEKLLEHVREIDGGQEDEISELCKDDMCIERSK